MAATKVGMINPRLSVMNDRLLEFLPQSNGFPGVR